MQHIQGFLRYLKFEKRYSVHTQRAYETDLIQYNDYLVTQYESTTVAATDVMIRSWMMFLIESSCSKRSLNRKLSSLRGFYKYASRNDLIKVNPMLRVVSMKTSKKIPPFISVEEINTLLDQIEYPANYEGVRDKAILQMFYYTGIRLSELIALRLDDVDFSQKQLKVMGKRSKERIVPLLDDHLVAIDKYLNYRLSYFESPAHNLFLTNSGDILYSKLVYRIVNSYLSNVTGVKQKSPHVLRHAFATHMLNDGADLNAIKEVLGHSSLSSTQIYTSNSAKRLKEIYKQAHPRGDK